MIDRVNDLIKDFWPMSLLSAGFLSAITTIYALKVAGWLITIGAGVVSIWLMWERKKYYKSQRALREKNFYRYRGKDYTK